MEIRIWFINTAIYKKGSIYNYFKYRYSIVSAHGDVKVSIVASNKIAENLILRESICL